jgi:hypothetical protein
VEPVAITEREDGSFDVDVHQVVRSPDGELLSDSRVVHTYVLREGLVQRMDIQVPGSTGPKRPG